MTGFLERLIAANLGTPEQKVRPRLASRFEPIRRSSPLVVDSNAVDETQPMLPLPAAKDHDAPRFQRKERELEARTRSIVRREAALRFAREDIQPRQDVGALPPPARPTGATEERPRVRTGNEPRRPGIERDASQPAPAGAPRRTDAELPPPERPAAPAGHSSEPVRTAEPEHPAHGDAIPDHQRVGRRDRHDRDSRDTEHKNRRDRHTATAPRAAVPRDSPGETRDGEAAPVIITIGRVEVRVAPPPPAQRPSAAKREPTQSLDEYLATRRGAER